MGYYYWDPTYILVVIGAVICMIASARVKGTFNKYSQLRSMSGMNGAQVAQRVLQAAGIYDVQVRHVSGSLTDHYDPRTKTVNLSDPVYNATSVAALGVAAHECGHAIQHAKSYAPLSIRSALVPIANFGSMLAWPVILIGLLFNTRSSGLIIDIGILLFSAAVLFQLVTLPVEFNASARALAIRIAEYTSLHCPISRSLGSPATVPKSSLLKRYLPHARVRIMQSSGTIVAKSVK